MGIWPKCRYNTHLHLIVGGTKSLYRCKRKRSKKNSLRIHWGIQNGYVLFSVKNGELLMINITRSQLFCNHFPSDFHWRLCGWKFCNVDQMSRYFINRMSVLVFLSPSCDLCSNYPPPMIICRLDMFQGLLWSAPDAVFYAKKLMWEWGFIKPS